MKIMILPAGSQRGVWHLRCPEGTSECLNVRTASRAVVRCAEAILGGVILRALGGRLAKLFKKGETFYSFHLVFFIFNNHSDNINQYRVPKKKLTDPKFSQ